MGIIVRTRIGREASKMLLAAPQQVPRARVGALQPYVPSAANDAAVAEMVKQGFSREQARAIVANASKPQDQAYAASAAYVATEANRIGVRKLVEAGYSEEEAKRLIAMGKRAEDILGSLSSYATMKVDEAAVKVLTDQGLSRAEAQALVSTGMDPKSLLALAQDGRARLKLLTAIDARLKSEGIDLKERAMKGLGLTDQDVKVAGQAVKAAQEAYKIYAGVESALEAYSAYHYFAGRWSEGAMNDASLGQLIEILDRLGQQNEEDRLRRIKQLTEGINTALESAATIASMFGPIGMAVGAVIYVASKVWDKIIPPSVTTDGNDQKFAAGAKFNAEEIWKQWGFVPPTFDTRFYTLQSYEATNGVALNWLQQSDKERPWRAKFKEILDKALTPQLYLRKTQVAAPVEDLASLGWIPFSFFEWVGGANLPYNRYWSGPDLMQSGRAEFDMYPVDAARDELAPEILVGGPGLKSLNVMGVSSESLVAWRKDPAVEGNAEIGMIFANRAATLEARNQSTLNREKLFDDNFMSWYSVPGSSRYCLPRNDKLQNLICERMATSMAIMVAVAHRRPAEPVIEFAVSACRYALSVYGWQPKNAAKRFRDVFLGTLEHALKLPELKGGDAKY